MDEVENIASKNDNLNQGGNTDAERALLRLKQKLQGYEYGEILSVSEFLFASKEKVEGQIKQLVGEAQDVEKLCKMFPGWAAWV